MKTLHPIRLTALALAALLALSQAAQAACYADYKAKRDNPLRLHYGVIQLSDSGNCPSAGQAAQLVSTRLQQADWQLLKVVSLFASPPTAEQRENAGDHYLRY